MTTALDAALDRARITDPSERQRLQELFADPEIAAALEAAGRTYARWKIAYICSFAIFVVPAFVVGLADSLGDAFLLGFVALFFCTLVFLFGSFMGRDTELKKTIVGKLLTLLRPGVSYSPDAEHAFEFDHLVDADLLHSYDRIDKREDSMEFEMRQDGQRLLVRGFELRTSRRRETKNGTQWVVADSCYLLRGEYPDIRFPISSPVLVSTDFSDSPAMGIISFVVALVFVFQMYFVIQGAAGGMDSLGWLSTVCLVVLAGLTSWGIRAFRNRHRARMENIAFEKLFDVRCGDQVLARRVLTPALMDRLVRFAGEHRGSYEFLFTGREVYLKKKLIGNYLEPSIGRDPSQDFGGIVGWYADLRESIALIADTGLLAFSRTSADAVESPAPQPAAS